MRSQRVAGDHRTSIVAKYVLEQVGEERTLKASFISIARIYPATVSLGPRCLLMVCASGNGYSLRGFGCPVLPPANPSSGLNI